MFCFFNHTCKLVGIFATVGLADQLQDEVLP
ncbi:hypothetical protein F957_01416 [Acinetobacter gyllenbergii CIP 110306 = MTCC 11365]|uniref:Uncharacterized protein n=1 Tax=Acinetobacter gyllenbergii CIP 110306 = MTCC 11365 TaxID=1217657 RepID=A0A829HJ94_9GAMM|nr:hypothetical protein F957_01416 [Acinetobacter gyllenbergii CIP 110306 = MTCC 11365]ESK55812.1 hypothetical protein F987_00436 [Acinetobacter gyllenbergii NIPH 230]